MEKIMDTVSGYVIQYGMSVIAAVAIFIVGKWLAKLASRLVGQAMSRAKINDTLVSFTKNIAYYIILIFVAIAALNKLGVETTSFVAIVGAAGLAVGLALQGSLSNFAAGVMLILFQPFKVGDEIEAGGANGIVQEIQIFSTIMMAKDKKKIIVPNAKIAADKITITPH
jgi:small conductance mechanosensitive channel